jgi:molybdenum cofactor cytidylyltransferase
VIAGIVLAAGESRRLGQPKQLLPLGATTVLVQVIAVAQACVDRIIVVLGAHAEAIRAGVDLRGASVVMSAEWAAGQSSSLRAGLAAAAQDPAIEAALVLLGDQPLVRRETITVLIARWQATHAAAVVPCYGEQQGNPALFGQEAWPQLMALQGDVGARDLLRRGAIAPIESVALPATWWPQDIDTWEDYRAVQAAWEE